MQPLKTMHVTALALQQMERRNKVPSAQGKSAVLDADQSGLVGKKNLKTVVRNTETTGGTFVCFRRQYIITGDL